MLPAKNSAWGLWVLKGLGCLSKVEPPAPETWASRLAYCLSLLVTRGTEATPPPDCPAHMVSQLMHAPCKVLHALNQGQTYICHMLVPLGRKCLWPEFPERNSPLLTMGHLPGNGTNLLWE